MPFFFFFFFFLRNRCIWPHIGEVKTWALRKSSVRPQSGYLYQSDVYWKSKTFIPPASQNQFREEERCEFCLVKYLLQWEDFWCGSDFSWSTHRLYCRQQGTHMLLPQYFVDKVAHFPSVDRCVTWFLLLLPRCSSPNPTMWVAWCACFRSKGRKNLTFSLSSK